MYNTTDVNGLASQQGVYNHRILTLQMSKDPNFFYQNRDFSVSSSTVHPTKGLNDCCATFFSVLVALSLSFLIALWIVAMIADGPDEFHKDKKDSCLILWPNVLGVLLIAVLFLLLRCSDYCYKVVNRRRNIQMANQPLGMMDSLQTQCRREADIPVVSFIVYQRLTCITMSYLFLTFALFCIIIASVVQFFSLDSECYHHLRQNVNELLLGYKVLAYIGVVVLATLACLLICLLFGITVHCCNKETDLKSKPRNII